MLLRSYSISLWEFSGYKKEGLVFIFYVSIYGLVGIFSRWPINYYSSYFKSRKTFIYIALIIQIFFYLPLFFYQSEFNLYLHTIAVGISASCIGIYNSLFVEQNNNKNQVINSVITISLPPLIADFMTAPLQSIFLKKIEINNILVYDISLLRYIVLISVLFSILCLVITFFIKENNELIQDIKNNKSVTYSKKNYYLEITLFSVIGFLIVFIKFLTSGTLATTYLQTISNLSSNSYEGYLSSIFSIFQVLAIFLSIFIYKTKYGRFKVLLLGFLSLLIFLVLNLLFINPLLFFISSSLNGFSYGLFYNLFTIQIFATLNSKYKNKSNIGIYQTYQAIGITLSLFTGSYLKSAYLNQNYIIIQYIVLIIILFILFFISIIVISKKRFNYQFQ